MPDTATNYAELTNTTISNTSTWDHDIVISRKQNGLIEFTDKSGNTVRSRQKTLVKLVERLAYEIN